MTPHNDDREAQLAALLDIDRSIALLDLMILEEARAKAIKMGMPLEILERGG